MNMAKTLDELIRISSRINVSRKDSTAYKLLNLGRTGNWEKIENVVLRLGTRLPEKDRKVYIEKVYETAKRKGWVEVAHLVAAGLLMGGEKHGEE